VARFLHVFPAGEVPLYGHHFHFREWIYGEVMTFKFLKTVLTTCRYAMCISLGVLSVSGTASATLIESIAALEEGAMYRVLFVTRDSTTAMSTDIDDYNTFVSNAAGSGSVTGSLGFTWKALASTSDVNAQDNTGVYASDYSMITMFNTNGQIVASLGGSDLWSGILYNPILYDENGIAVSKGVWTGTSQTGETDTPLGGSPHTLFGLSQRADALWTARLYGGSFFDMRVYAVSSVSVKAMSNVPEPGTIILLSLGLAGLSFVRYVKQS
jgi:hypothetical protein